MARDLKPGRSTATWLGLAVLAWPCLAADAAWVAQSALADGTSPYCAGGQFPGPQWTAASEGEVRISGTTLTYTTSPGRFPASSFSLDLAALRPDGSGTVAGRDERNREFLVTFAPGSGPRPFEVTNAINACRRVFTPRPQ